MVAVRMAALVAGLSVLTAGMATAAEQPGAQPGAQPNAQNRAAQPNAQNADQERRFGEARQAHKGEICMASKLEQMTVKTQDGQQVGQVKDLLIDTQSGQVQFVAISAANAAANERERPATTPATERPAGEQAQQGQYIVVPWSALQAQKAQPGQAEGQQHLTLNLSKDRLQQAPRFSQQQLASPQGSDEWAGKIHQFYGTGRTEVLRPELNNRQGTTSPRPDGIRTQPEARQPETNRGENR